MQKLLRNFRAALSDDKPVFGPFMKTTDPAFVEAAGYAGFDIAVGTFVDDFDLAAKWKKTGVRYLSYSVDVGIFYETCCRIKRRISASS